MRGDIDRKRSQNAQPQNEILRLKGGLGGAALNKQVCGCG